MLFVILEAHQIWLTNDLKLMSVSETQLSDGTGGGPRSQKNSSDIHRLHSHPLTDATSSLLPPPRLMQTASHAAKVYSRWFGVRAQQSG